MAFPAFADHCLGLCIGQVFDALLGAEMEFDPAALILGIDEAEGMAAETVHVAVAGRNAPVAHDDGDLVQGLGQRGPEVPVVEGAAQVGAGVAFDGMVQVGKLQRVAQEKHRRIIAHKVPVALLGVELHGKAPDIALGIGSSPLAGNRGKADEEVGLFADSRKYFRFGIFGNIMRDGKGAVGARALGMHAPLGDYLPVEMGKLLQKPDILQKLRPPGPAVMTFWLSATGAPVLLVSFFCVSHGNAPFLGVYD